MLPMLQRNLAVAVFADPSRWQLLASWQMLENQGLKPRFGKSGSNEGPTDVGPF